MQESEKRRINEVLQNKENFSKPYFKNSAFEIIKETREILLLIRRPYTAGGKDYFLFKSKEELNKIFDKLKSGDALTIIKDYTKIKETIIDEELIVELKNSYNIKRVDWLLFIFEKDGEQWSNWITDEEDFKDCIEEEKGSFIVLMEDPDWLNEETTIHAYVPDPDGIVRPGAY